LRETGRSTWKRLKPPVSALQALVAGSIPDAPSRKALQIKGSAGANDEARAGIDSSGTVHLRFEEAGGRLLDDANGLVCRTHGKEGVSGSSPSEGFNREPANQHFIVACASNTRTHSRHICGTRDTSRRLATPSDTTSLIDEIPAKRGDTPFLPGCAYLLRPGDQASETCIKPIPRSVASSSSARIIGPPTCCSKSRLLTNELLLSVRERGREEREVQFRDVLPGQLPNCCPIGCGRGDICINGRCEDG